MRGIEIIAARCGSSKQRTWKRARAEGPLGRNRPAISHTAITPPLKRRDSAANLPRESRLIDAMQDRTSKLAEKLLIIYEMDGRDAVEQYARRNGIPLAVSLKIISEYEIARGMRALAAGR
jgi:hypothetical protein